MSTLLLPPAHQHASGLLPVHVEWAWTLYRARQNAWAAQESKYIFWAIDLIVSGLCNAAARSITISLDPLASLPHPDAGYLVDFQGYEIDNLGVRGSVSDRLANKRVTFRPPRGWNSGYKPNPDTRIKIRNRSSPRRSYGSCTSYHYRSMWAGCSPAEWSDFQGHIQAVPLVSQMIIQASSTP